MVTMQQIRERYPNPRKLLDSGLLRGSDYCVGGAVCKMVNGPRAADFPSVVELSSALFKLNPRSEIGAIVHLVGLIVQANDRGDFDLAWAKVEEVLSSPILTILS